MVDGTAGRDPIGRLLKRARLTDEVRSGASLKWRADRDAVVKGIVGDGEKPLTEDAASRAKRLYVRYTNLRRLQSEYMALAAHHDDNSSNINNRRRILFYVIDPHILRMYADAWNDDNGLTGFAFLSNEWRYGTEEIEERRWFFLHLIQAIFTTTTLGLTISARDALMQAITFFSTKKSGENRRLADRLQRYEALLDLLKDVDGPSEGDSRQKLQRHYRHLVAATNFRATYPDIEIARLNRLLEKQRFRSIRNLIADPDNGLSASERETVLRLLGRLDRYPERVAQVQLDVDRAFTDFFHLTEIASSELRSQRSSTAEPHGQVEDGATGALARRNREYLQRRAITEIHLANLCLEQAGVDAEIRYITFSGRLFDFIDPLSRNLRVPLLHPRFLFAYRNPEFADRIRRGMDTILSAFSAALEVIDKDKIINPHEIDAVDKFNRDLEPLRNTNSFGFLSAQPGMMVVEDIMKGVRRAAEELVSEGRSGNLLNIDKVREKILGKLTALEHQILEGRDHAPRIFTDEFSKPREESRLYLSFRNLTEALAPESRPRILVRMVRNGEGMPLRLVCLPVSGAYRYMFSITSAVILSRLEDDMIIEDMPELIDLLKFIDKLEGIVQSERTPSIEDGGMLRFVRAFHAASYRDWSLADLLAQRALDELENVKKEERGARYYFLIHELHFLRNLSTRGLAEQRHRGFAHVRMMTQSFDHLRNSAQSVVEAYNCEDRDESFTSDGPVLGTMTYRLALAFAGTMAELLITQKGLSIRRMPQDLDGEPIFNPGWQPKEAGKSFAWDLAGFDGFSVRDAWANPAEMASVVGKGLLRLIESTKAALARDAGRAHARFDPVLWNFRLMRTCQLFDFFVLLIQQDRIHSGRLLSGLNHSDVLKTFGDSLNRFKVDVKTLAGTQSTDSLALMPFAGVQCARMNVPTDISNRLDLIAALQAYDQASAGAESLDPLGLPKNVALTMLADWRRRLIEGMRHPEQLFE